MKEILELIGEAFLIATFQQRPACHDLPRTKPRPFAGQLRNRSSRPRRLSFFSDGGQPLRKPGRSSISGG